MKKLATLVSLFLFTITTVFCQAPYLELWHQSDVDALDSLYPDGLTSVYGVLAIGPFTSGPTASNPSNITDLSPLRRLKSVGALWIGRNPQLASLAGMDSLENVRVWIRVEDNPVLTSVKELRKMKGGSSWISFQKNPELDEILLDSIQGPFTDEGISIFSCPKVDTIAFPRVKRIEDFFIADVGIRTIDTISFPMKSTSSDLFTLWGLPNLETLQLPNQYYDTINQAYSDIKIRDVPKLKTIYRSSLLGDARINIENAYALPTVDSIYRSAYYYRSSTPGIGTKIVYAFSGLHSLDSAFVGYQNLPNEELIGSFNDCPNLRILKVDSTNSYTRLALTDVPKLDSIIDFGRRSGISSLTLISTGFKRIPSFGPISGLYISTVKNNKFLESIPNPSNTQQIGQFYWWEGNPLLRSVPDFSSFKFPSGSIEMLDNLSLTSYEFLPQIDSLTSLYLGYSMAQQFLSTPLPADPSYIEPTHAITINGLDSVRSVTRFYLGLKGEMTLMPFKSLEKIINERGHDYKINFTPGTVVSKPEGPVFPALKKISAQEFKLRGFDRSSGIDSTVAPSGLSNFIDLGFPVLDTIRLVWVLNLNYPDGELYFPWTHKVNETAYYDPVTDTLVKYETLRMWQLTGANKIASGMDSVFTGLGVSFAANAELEDCSALCTYFENGSLGNYSLELFRNGSPTCSDLGLLLASCDSSSSVVPSLLQPDFKLFPNPAASYLDVTLSEDAIHEIQQRVQETSYLIFDTRGQLVKEGRLSITNSVQRISLESLPTGSYILSVRGVPGARLFTKV